MGSTSVACDMVNSFVRRASGVGTVRSGVDPPFDVVLMDLQMPAMNGLEAMIAIRNEFPAAKIIILTTYENDVEATMKLGAQAYLLKTRLDKELLGTIRAVHSGN